MSEGEGLWPPHVCSRGLPTDNRHYATRPHTSDRAHAIGVWIVPDTYIPLGHSIDGAWPRNEHQPVCTACVHACYPSNRGLTRTTPPWLLSSTGQQGAVMGHVASVRNHCTMPPRVIRRGRQMSRDACHADERADCGSAKTHNSRTN